MATAMQVPDPPGGSLTDVERAERDELVRSTIPCHSSINQ